MAYQLTRGRCACGRGINKGGASCWECRSKTIGPRCACGRGTKLGAATCYKCRQLVSCIDCGSPAHGGRCRACTRDTKRTREAADLRAQGLSLREIGEAMGGVSRQRVEQVLNRPAQRTREAVRRALAAGRLLKPAACERCEILEPDLEAHHPDYNKPLEVQWVCVPCHSIVHPHHPGSRSRYGKVTPGVPPSVFVGNSRVAA